MDALCGGTQLFLDSAEQQHFELAMNLLVNAALHNSNRASNQFGDGSSPSENKHGENRLSLGFADFGRITQQKEFSDEVPRAADSPPVLPASFNKPPVKRPSSSVASTPQNQTKTAHNSNNNNNNSGTNSIAASTVVTGGATTREDRPTFCLICAAEATCFHYGVVSCKACAMFFRRAIMSRREYLCHEKARHCDLFAGERCNACRFDRCLELGMDPALIKFPKRALVRVRRESYLEFAMKMRDGMLERRRVELEEARRQALALADAEGEEQTKEEKNLMQVPSLEIASFDQEDYSFLNKEEDLSNYWNNFDHLLDEQTADFNNNF